MCLILMIELARAESKKKLWLCLGFAEVGLKAIICQYISLGVELLTIDFVSYLRFIVAALVLKPFYTM